MENGGGVAARELVADKSDLGAVFLRLDKEVDSVIDDAFDLGARSEPLSEKVATDDLSRGFLPLSISFSLSGSSSKST